MIFIKIFLICVTMGILASCGKEVKTTVSDAQAIEQTLNNQATSEDKVQSPTDCYVEKKEGYSILTCGDSFVFIEDGKDGINGQDGSSCSVVNTDSGVDIQCTDGTSGSVEDGKDGEDGLDGYVDLIQLCPEVSGTLIETLLFVNGKYMAFLSDPEYKKQRLVVLEENKNYQTTDGRSITFKIVGTTIKFTNSNCLEFTPLY